MAFKSQEKKEISETKQSCSYLECNLESKLSLVKETKLEKALDEFLITPVSVRIKPRKLHKHVEPSTKSEQSDSFHQSNKYGQCFSKQQIRNMAQRILQSRNDPSITSRKKDITGKCLNEGPQDVADAFLNLSISDKEADVQKKEEDHVPVSVKPTDPPEHMVILRRRGVTKLEKVSDNNRDRKLKHLSGCISDEHKSISGINHDTSITMDSQDVDLESELSDLIEFGSPDSGYNSPASNLCKSFELSAEEIEMLNIENFLKNDQSPPDSWPKWIYDELEFLCSEIENVETFTNREDTNTAYDNNYLNEHKNTQDSSQQSHGTSELLMSSSSISTPCKSTVSDTSFAYQSQPSQPSVADLWQAQDLNDPTSYLQHSSVNTLHSATCGNKEPVSCTGSVLETNSTSINQNGMLIENPNNTSMQLLPSCSYSTQNVTAPISNSSVQTPGLKMVFNISNTCSILMTAPPGQCINVCFNQDMPKKLPVIKPREIRPKPPATSFLFREAMKKSLNKEKEYMYDFTIYNAVRKSDKSNENRHQSYNVICIVDTQNQQTILHKAVIKRNLELIYCLVEIQRQMDKAVLPQAIMMQDVYDKSALDYIAEDVSHVGSLINNYLKSYCKN